MKLRVFALTLAVAALAGCASPQMSLTKQAQANIEQVEGILTIPQSNLDVTVQATNPGNTGLIGALIAVAIDAARQSSAEKAAAPLLEPLRDYDFRTAMLNASTDALTKMDKVKIMMPLHVEVVASDASKKIAFEQTAASAILFCNVGYHLESGNLIVTANAEMYPKIEKLREFRNKPDETNPLNGGNAIYRKTFTFVKQAVAPITIKEDLSEAATSVASQLAADLNGGI
ncbi:MAG: hypothetical protein ACLPXB_05565 [Thiobacillaceae bacterium]